MAATTFVETLSSRALKRIPGGVNSPVRSFQKVQASPIFAQRALGAKLWDVEGNVYTDYCQSWGTSILGHAPECIVAAVHNKARLGLGFGLTTESEVALAEKIASHYPSIEKVRFVSTGTEATMTALRIARGVTGRSKVITFHGNYHGHSDGLLPLSSGVPKESLQTMVSLPYNALDEVCAYLESHGEAIAAVIIEPIAGNMGTVAASRDFLQMLREMTRKSGTLLIFDEIITGYRVGLHGAQGLYGILPDITTLGKIIGGGLPAAAIGGPAQYMEALAPTGTVYQAGTFSGNPLAMAAGYSAISQCEQRGFYDMLEEKGRFLENGLLKVLVGGRIARVGSMFTIFWDSDERFAAFFHHLLERGIFIPPSQGESCFLSAAHTFDDLSLFIAAASDFGKER